MHPSQPFARWQRHHPRLQGVYQRAVLRQRMVADLGLHRRLVAVFVRHEHMGEGRVHRVVEPRQGFDGPRPRHGHIWQEVGLGKAFVQIPHHGQNLRQHLAAIDQHRHLAIGVDGFEFRCELLAFVQLDHDGLKGHSGFFQHEVGHKRTRAG